MKINNKEVLQSYILTTAKYDYSVYEKRILYRLIEVFQKYTTGNKLNDKVIIQKDLFDVAPKIELKFNEKPIYFRDIFVGNPDCFSPEEIPCELKTLLKQPILMLSSKSTTSEYLHQMFATHGLNLLPEVELNSNDLLMDLARIGLGIACIPDYMLNPDDSLKPIPLADPLPPRQLVLVQHDSLPLSQAAERFLDMFS